MRTDSRIARCVADAQALLGDDEKVQIAVPAAAKHPIFVPPLWVETRWLIVTDRRIRLFTPRRLWKQGLRVGAEVGSYPRDSITWKALSFNTRIDFPDGKRGYVYPNYWRRLEPLL